jgi:hypothetical protein
LAETGIVDIVVRISVTRNIERVEEIRSEAEHLFVPDMEVLKDRKIHLPVTRTALFLSILQLSLEGVAPFSNTPERRAGVCGTPAPSFPMTF